MIIDWTPYLLLFLSAVLMPSAGWLVSSTVSVKAKLKAHEATDAVRFENIQSTLEDLKTGQKDTGEKLDRLIERFL